MSDLWGDEIALDSFYLIYRYSLAYNRCCFVSKCDRLTFSTKSFHQYEASNLPSLFAVTPQNRLWLVRVLIHPNKLRWATHSGGVVNEPPNLRRKQPSNKLLDFPEPLLLNRTFFFRELVLLLSNVLLPGRLSPREKTDEASDRSSKPRTKPRRPNLQVQDDDSLKQAALHIQINRQVVSTLASTHSTKGRDGGGLFTY